MKLLRTLFAAVAAAFLISAARAADTQATPAGNWKWTGITPHGEFEVTAKFEFKDGALTGTVTVPGNEAAISNASFKDGAVAFTVVRQMQEMRFEIKYSGKLAGDTITGSIDRPTPDGEREQVEWKATRVK